MTKVKAARVEAIRARRDVERLRQYFTSTHAHGRLYGLILTLGCNFGLRAGDLLALKMGDVRGKTHLEVIEQKTGKPRRIYINNKAREAISEYTRGYIFVDDEAALFAGQKGYVLTVKSLHKIIKRGCREIGLVGNYGTHSMRKTFAYHAFQYTNDIRAVKQLLNHSDVSVTRAYVESETDEGEPLECSEDEIYASLNL